YDLARCRAAGFGWNPHVSVAPSKSRGHNPNQGSRYAVQYKRLVYNCGVGAKALHPCLVAQHKYWRRSRLVIGWLHHPPEQRRHSQKLEGSGRYVITVKALRTFTRPVQHIRLVIRNHPVKHMILFHIFQELRPGIARSPAWLTPFRVMDLDGKVPLGIRVGEGLHQNIVDNAENCRGRSNPQRQSKYGDGRKSWRPAKVP